MKSLRIFAILLILACLVYSCSSSRSSSAEEGKKRRKITGVTPGIKNPSRGVINASGDGLTPGIGQSNGAGSEENATSIANNAIAKANAMVRVNQQKLAAMSDEELVNKMLTDQQIEVKRSENAVRTTANTRIKDYAAMVLTDHAEIQHDLKKLSGSKNMALVTLKSLNVSSRTDLEFVEQMIESNQNMIALYTAAGKSKDPAIRAFALKQLPVLRKHLEAAQELTKVFKPKQ
ncbi:MULTISPECIES: DUF4142 domain-containing protein [Pedobacter]|uniref:DUF4142 domain-containing protein n=1 Tax=Pedobacter heparinus (strain ATCC 13125 / DSM 2366 / CIP 104194 / JCM 7457 / NBRC 12017 / NCIMB 9290 / NRRL B-14731 / HIM 762-3) TaxID=485917 RepID=C6XZD3_PEDHD|nr:MULTISPECIES: DUF4142 domain-containing protein [Pedobacter]ACU04629.1 hypothetical protein Phep_2425 [Pedobacter heparinus DSM 2366]MBB5437520.1 putative outer membrane protein [Pedobacter sp. AK017]